VTGQADGLPEETSLIDALKILDLAHRQIAELKEQVSELTAELATERASLASLGREFIELARTEATKIDSPIWFVERSRIPLGRLDCPRTSAHSHTWNGPPVGPSQ
jgi:hypothetical protein